MLAPLLMLLERSMTSAPSKRKAVLKMFGYCWLAATIAAPIGGHAITSSVNVFGHMPLFISVLVTALGYGLEVALVLFTFFAIPLLLSPRHLWLDLPMRLLWVVMLEPHYPRLFDWSFGGWALYQFPLIEQTADLVGMTGMSLLSVGSNFVLLLWWRQRQVSPDTSVTLARNAALIWLGLMLSAAVYGAWRISHVREQPVTSQLQVAAIQPNFSLQQLASNPNLTYSVRERNLEGLLADSRQALRQLPLRAGTPRLLIWPESTFPAPILKDAEARGRVAEFARAEQTFVLLTSVDWERLDSGRYRFYGISVLIDPRGELIARYNKIFLIPFGETIPLAQWFPWYAEWLRELAPNISEFEAGTAYTVMPVGDAAVAAPICFDGFSPEILRNMSANGAQVAALMGNLAWFGRSTATDQMEMVARWRTLENRIHMLLVTNSGASQFLDTTGAPLSPRLGLFEQGALTATMALQSTTSFYQNYARELAWFWAGSWLVALILLSRARRSR